MISKKGGGSWDEKMEGGVEEEEYERFMGNISIATVTLKWQSLSGFLIVARTRALRV